MVQCQNHKISIPHQPYSNLTNFKENINLAQVLLFTYVLAVLHRAHVDLSSPVRDGTHAPCSEMRSLNYWTTGEVQQTPLLKKSFLITPISETKLFLGMSQELPVESV